VSGSGDRRWQTVELEAERSVAYLRFNRPDSRNGVVSAMFVEVYEAVRWVSERPEIDVLVLTGNGSTFCPGADLGRAGDQSRGQTALPAPEAYHSAELLHAMPQVTVAAINGACAGAGFAWAASCDLRVAADSARFSVAFLELGLPGELGLAWTLPRILGASAAREVLFLPRKFRADELRDLHFIAAVFPQADFAGETDRFVADLAGHGGHALRLLKQNLLDAERLPLGEYLDIETDRHQGLFRGDAANRTRARLAAQAARIRDAARKGTA
jgi:2-(1,2-epoxy-1,2-dihydrophenyl)acetyl-CoA isomerase